MRRPKLKFHHGAWRVLFYDRDLEGKLHARMVTLKDCNGVPLREETGPRALQRALSDAEHANSTIVRHKSNLTVSGMLDRFLQLRGPSVRPATIRSYRLWCARFADQFGPLRAAAVSIQDCETWRASLITAYAPSSVNIALRSLRAAFAWAIDTGIISSNPMRKVPLVRIARETAPRVISWEQFERIILPRLDRPRDRLIYMLAIYAGLRRGEILALRWEHIDFNAGAIRVHNTATFQTKSGRARQVPIVPILETELRQAARSGPWVVGTSRTQPNDTRWIQRWHDLIRKLNRSLPDDEQLPDIRIHDLRASYCTELLHRLPPAVVQQIMGHADIQTTMRFYAHLDQSSAFLAARTALQNA